MSLEMIPVGFRQPPVLDAVKQLTSEIADLQQRLVKLRELLKDGKPYDQEEVMRLTNFGQVRKT